MRKYWENINIARIITAENIYPKEHELYNAVENSEDDDPYRDRSTKPTFTRKFVWWMQAVIVIFSLLTLLICGFDCADSKYWLLFVAGTVVISLLGELAYLMTYNIKFEVSCDHAQVKMGFSNIPSYLKYNKANAADAKSRTAE